MCQFCTYVNASPAVVCEMCNLGGSPPASLQQTPAGAKDQAASPPRPQPKARVDVEVKRQKMMRDDGLRLVQQIRVGHRDNSC